MDNPQDQGPVFSHVEPVLPVANVADTIRYWQDVLAFPEKWTWGEPPTHGGVSWHTARIQFSQNVERAKGSAGNVVWIRVGKIDQLYKIHQQRNATIEQPLKHMPWGLNEYIVKDLNGYYVVFSGFMNDRAKSGVMPPTVKVVKRAPTKEEFLTLATSVGWLTFISQEHIDAHISAPVFSVVAVDTEHNKTVGCALVLSDSSSFYYIKDVMVHPEWQGKRIGTALMNAISLWLDNNAINKSLVGLYTGDNLEPFYKQFGFQKAFGMVRRIARH